MGRKVGDGSQTHPKAPECCSMRPDGYPGVSLSVHWGEDMLQGVRVWGGAHEQPPACSEQSTAVSPLSANNEASLSAHNVPSVLSAAQW